MRAGYGQARAELEKILATETDDCVIWPYSQSKGYPKAQIGGRDGHVVNLHRYVCECAHGPAPSKTHHAAHICGNSMCLNSRHIRWATPKENSQDQLVHGTRNMGSKNGQAVLTWDQAAEIRTLYSAGGVSQREIAERYGITQSMVSRIVLGKNWKAT